MIGIFTTIFIVIIIGVCGTIYLASRLKTTPPIISDKDRAYTEWVAAVLEYVNKHGNSGNIYPYTAFSDKEAFEMGISPSEFGQLIIFSYQ